MHTSQGFLTTQEFAKKAGINTSTVTKWLRSGKLKGRKEGSKWLISADQLPGGAPVAKTTEQASAPTPAPAARTAAPQRSGRSYSVEEFSAMTYLTDFGVQKWLKEGRLKGVMDNSGQWRVDDVNLQDPKVQRLVRK